MMKKAIFVTVRSGSTRLPKKCLLEIAGMPSIKFLIQRVKRSKLSDVIVLCTTTLSEDDALCRIASQCGIEYFRGPAKDKLTRWLLAAQKHNVEFFVTADGDDLFYEPQLIDLAFEQYERNHPDFIESKDVPCGAFTYSIKTSALKKVCEMKDTEDTEMMWIYFKETGLFKVETLENVPVFLKRPQIRMTLDYEDDYKFFKAIVENFMRNKKENFNLKDIIEFLDNNPDVVKINHYLQERYLANQKKKTKLCLKPQYRQKALNND